MFTKKLSINSNNALKIPVDLSLKMSPTCQTLSKAIESKARFNSELCIKGCVYIMPNK